MKILLVEDDACLAEALSEAIADQLYVVEIASDGEAAWEQIRSTKYD
jgi:DNA-binding response OmpR family regulator